MGLNGQENKIGQGNSTEAETATANEQHQGSNSDRTNTDEIKESEDVAEETKERTKVES